MSIVVEVISEYLRSNRRLVVPAFGAFVVKESGERIFSDLLNSDDGVLVSLLRDRGLNELEVSISIDRFTFHVRHELEQYGYCRLGEVGTLRVEPATKIIRLYPPVQGELPKQTPYVPKPIVEEKQESVAKQEPTEKRSVEEKEPAKVPNATAPKTVKLSARPRKKFDLVMVIAAIILTVALLAIGYGWYVSDLSTADDDAEMDALRVVPSQTLNE